MMPSLYTKKICEDWGPTVKEEKLTSLEVGFLIDNPATAVANKGAGLLLDNLVSHCLSSIFIYMRASVFPASTSFAELSKLMFLICLIRSWILWSGQILSPEVEISWNLWHRWTDSRLRHLTNEGCICSHKLNTVAQMLHVYLLYSPFRCVAWGRSKTSMGCNLNLYAECFFQYGKEKKSSS